MNSRAREKFYDLYAILQGDSIPEREPVIFDEASKKKKKNIKKNNNSGVVVNDNNEEKIPDALEKVMKEFYQQEVEDEENYNKKDIKIGKDALELKHEHDLANNLDKGQKNKKKKKKRPLEQMVDDLCKEFVSKTGEAVVGMNMNITPMKKKQKKIKELNSEISPKRNVSFDLKLNRTQLFDKKNSIGSLNFSLSPAPQKGILKQKNSAILKKSKPKKRPKLNNDST